MCIDVLGGMGFCAEDSAAVAMVMADESKIVKIVEIGVDDNGYKDESGFMVFE